MDFVGFLSMVIQIMLFYCIVQNSGGGKLWRIWRIRSNSPKFYPSKFTYQIISYSRLPKYSLGKMHTMSILKYFHPLREKPNLPDPSSPLRETVPPTAIFEAKVKVNAAELKKIASQPGQWNRTYF